MENTENDRLRIVQRKLNFSSQVEFANVLGIKQGSLSDIYRKKNGVGVSESIKRKLDKDYSINIDWLTTGEGKMLKNETVDKKNGNLIPFYDDTISVGGTNQVANVDGVSQPAEYIDAGDWFREATAAIRHYGESMEEYPTGCILALREVTDRNLVIPGRDYVIETSEYRVTKRLQLGRTSDSITAYSTNKETYPDGRLVHEPFEISWSAIVHIFLVLGYVVKKNGGTMVFNGKN